MRLRKPANARDCGGEFEDAAVIDFVEHRRFARVNAGLLSLFDNPLYKRGWRGFEVLDQGLGLTSEARVAEQTFFAMPGGVAELEEGLDLAPKFDADGLVTAVATDAASGDVLMVAHMNAEALAKTIASGEAHYYSRSRRKLW